MEKYIEEGKREKKKKIEGARRGCEGYRVVLFQDPQYHTESLGMRPHITCTCIIHYKIVVMDSS